MEQWNSTIKKVVAIGSTNPAKIAAVKTAFRKVWPNQKYHFKSLEVHSGVSEQPMSDEESIRGAQNRARQALSSTGADFGVGLEGGLQEIQGRFFDCGWIVVIDKGGVVGIGSTARVVVPKKILNLLKEKQDLGAALDAFFNKKDIKKGSGHFGIMTNNIITRSQGYCNGVIMALTRFMHPELFEKKE